jgi:hypothetical protein
MPEENILNRLDALAPEARARVEAALKTNIEAELAGGALSGVNARDFSRGIIFSKVVGARPVLDDLMVNQAVNMDDEAFKKFADRLTNLKNLGSGG